MTREPRSTNDAVSEPLSCGQNGVTCLQRPADAMPNHASVRTTQLDDRHQDEMSLDEAERPVI